MSVLNEQYFNDAGAAREHLEAIRWPNGPVCPHCGCVGHITKLNGAKHRKGVYKCNDCRKQFTVTVGTVFEGSHVPLHKWFQAVYFLCSSKKGMSSHQLHRTLGVTYKTAWFMAHRIREAMSHDGLAPKIGGPDSTVEADETFWGNKPGVVKPARARGMAHKESVFSMVERGGQVRSFHTPNIKADTLVPLLISHVEPGTTIYTDEARQYRRLDKMSEFPHDVVEHQYGEYVRGDVGTNTVEGFFGIFKRGMRGTYQHCSSHHLRRYVAEFDFRYNHRDVSDLDRTIAALRGISGKRLYYALPN